MDTSIKFAEGTNGPFKPSDGLALFVAIDQFIENSNLTETGKKVRSGQLCAVLTKCLGQSWPGMQMVNREFADIDIFVERTGEVLNVQAMIVDDQGDCYDLDEAIGKIDWMIPVEEIYKRAAQCRDNPSFDD